MLVLRHPRADGALGGAHRLVGPHVEGHRQRGGGQVVGEEPDGKQVAHAAKSSVSPGGGSTAYPNSGRSPADGAARRRGAPRPRGWPPGPRGAHEQALLDEERLVDVLDGLGRLADADGQGRQPDRSAAEALAERRQDGPVDLVEAELVDPEHGQAVVGGGRRRWCRRRAPRRSRAPGAAAGWRCGACPGPGGRSRRRRRRRRRRRGCRRPARRSPRGRRRRSSRAGRRGRSGRAAGR